MRAWGERAVLLYLQAAGKTVNMQREPIRDETSTVPLVTEKRRVRTNVWYLKRRAERRRRHANLVVVGSIVVLGVVVWILYAVLAS